MPKQNSAAPLATGALAGQKGGAILLSLNFLWLLSLFQDKESDKRFALVDLSLKQHAAVASCVWVCDRERDQQHNDQENYLSHL